MVAGHVIVAVVLVREVAAGIDAEIVFGFAEETVDAVQMMVAVVEAWMV